MALMESFVRYSPSTGMIEGKQAVERRLSQLPGVFADPLAYARALQSADPLIYSVSGVEPAHGEGQLHYGLGVLLPGQVGAEYYLTRGHLHASRAAAEVYIGLRGQGLMLLENEQTGVCSAVELVADSAVYVPGYTAHRTVNTGSEPLVYWGVYPSDAGHDYQSIQQRNFRQVVICVDGRPVVMERSDYMQTLARQSA